MRTTSLGLLAVVTMLVAQPAGAQNRERDRERERRLDRMAERIAAATERVAERASEIAERVAKEIERQFEDWDDEGRRDSKHRWSAEEVRIDTTFAFSKDGTVDLSSVSGDIVVNGWNRNEARVRAYSERGQIKSSFGSSRLTLDAEAVRGRMGETRYEVSVPQGVRLILRSRSGDMTARNTLGAVDASTTSGDVILTTTKGRVSVENVSGDVQIAEATGDVTVNSVNGDVELDGVTGDVRVESTGGDISIENAVAGSVEATTVNGDVHYSGTIDGKGRYEFHSHSGDVVLEVPSKTSAQFSVETYSGELDSEFTVTLQPNTLTSRNEDRGRRRHRLDFTVGNGEARVIADSFSGDVVIRRR